MFIATLLGLLASPSFASGLTCVDGLKLDCAFVAVAEAHEQNPTARTTRKLKRLARRRHVGAQVLLMTMAERDASPRDLTKFAKKLANRGISHGFQQWAISLAQGLDSPDEGGDLLMEGLKRGPAVAMFIAGFSGLHMDGGSRAIQQVSVSALVAACLMASEEACHVAAQFLWEPGAAHHNPELARWLADKAVALGAAPRSKKLLSLIILESDPDPSENERVVSLLSPLSDAGDLEAMAWLAGALAKRGADEDRTRAVELLSAGVRAGSYDAAQHFCLLTMLGQLGEPNRLFASDSFERATAILREHGSTMYHLCGGIDRKDGDWVDIRLGTASAFDPIEAALQGARGGDLESMEVLARHVAKYGSEAAVVADRAGFLRSVEESLCAVGTQGIPSYLHMVRALGGAMDTVTQAGWLFLVKDDRPWDPEQPLQYEQAREEIWAELSGKDLIVAESIAMELRAEIASKNPECALLR